MIKPENSGDMEKEISFEIENGYNSNTNDSIYTNRNSLGSEWVQVPYPLPIATPIVGRITPTGKLMIVVNENTYYIDVQKI